MARSSKKGYPILLSGAIIFLLFALMPIILPMTAVHLIWVIGLGAIFPLGLLIAKLLNIQLLTTDNPLATLGGIVAAPQAFFIPVFIIVYMYIPEYLPFTVGLLGGSHFLPYMWIYRSKAYLFVTLATCLSSLILGGFLVDYAFTLVPLAIVAIYGSGVWLIIKELKQEAVSQKDRLLK
ncbi:DUF7010 family protein [Bacillus thermotolerans]|uniref:DUF7010 family protein n=1 Tax=Bacillus thermotolerans TaxID=1221996 RepID=UPI000C020074